MFSYKERHKYQSLSKIKKPIKSGLEMPFGLFPHESNIPIDSFGLSFFDEAMPFVDVPLLQKAVRLKQAWAIGSGKGGVGKSFLASSLAIALARLGFKVIGVDLDLGGANFHTTLGVDLPAQTLSDFISKKIDDIHQCIVPTGIPNLGLISGAHDMLMITEMHVDEKILLLKKLREIDADYLIYDLGAGTGEHTVDFFNFSDQGLIVILPEPTSIENAYRFIKSAYYRYLGSHSQLQGIRHLIALAMDHNNNEGIHSPSDLFREVNQMNPELGICLKKAIQSFSPQLVINQVRTQNDIEIGNSIKTVCKKYFGFDLQFLGHLEYDTAVWQAIRKKRPLLLEFSNSRISTVVDNFVRRLIQKL